MNITNLKSIRFLCIKLAITGFLFSCGNNNTTNLENHPFKDTINSSISDSNKTKVDTPTFQNKVVEAPPKSNKNDNFEGDGSGGGRPGNGEKGMPGGGPVNPTLLVTENTSPEKVAKAYLTYFLKQKYSQAKSYADEKATKYLQILEGSNDNFNSIENLKFISAETVLLSELSSKVIFELSYNKQNSDNEIEKTEIVKLIKTNNIWKVTR